MSVEETGAPEAEGAAVPVAAPPERHLGRWKWTWRALGSGTGEAERRRIPLGPTLPERPSQCRREGHRDRDAAHERTRGVSAFRPDGAGLSAGRRTGRRADRRARRCRAWPRTRRPHQGGRRRPLRPSARAGQDAEVRADERHDVVERDLGDRATSRPPPRITSAWLVSDRTVPMHSAMTAVRFREARVRHTERAERSRAPRSPVTTSPPGASSGDRAGAAARRRSRPRRWARRGRARRRPSWSSGVPSPR